MSDQAEDVSESSSSRKRVQRKKPVITGIWPCKINGCNKQFAREADLKRHQRTTKLHSMPSFACPQCDATFTRTDALRRHQKSRHNGVIIEPVEQSRFGDEEARSRSGTPSLKGKEKATEMAVTTHQGPATHAGPSSYYRSHTATTTPYIPPRPAPLVHPTSDVRTQWPHYPQNWQQQPAPYYQSRHYRPQTTGYHTARSPESYHDASATTSRNTSSQPPNSSESTIDPDLDPELTAADVVAAVRAVLLHAESEEKAKQQREQEERLLLERETGAIESSIDGYAALRRPEPMEHILTEDGEPMLNPAELLTQESLASPPPS